MVTSINEMSLKIAQTEKIQTEFISSISHELRTPLTAITAGAKRSSTATTSTSRRKRASLSSSRRRGA
jgi:K+-sensing histidine kinase KdpD